MGIVDELKAMFNMSESQRRSHVGMEVAFWQAGGLGIIGTLPPRKKYAGPLLLLLPDVTLGNLQLTRKQRFEMLRRSKMLLSMRCSYEEVAKRLERRREWNIARLPVIENNLDLFPAVKYSYSSRRPSEHEISLVVSDGGTVRFDGVVRSCNMRLDPVDAVRIAYKKRKEIQRALQWGYDNGQIPVMLTFTIFHDHTWQPLDKLIAVLRNSYSDMFDHKVGEQLRDKIGFRYRIFRMEETIDIKNSLVEQDEKELFASCLENGERGHREGEHDGKHGWHPHYHVILFVPKDNLKVLEELEPKLKLRWQKLVQKHYAKFVGKEIPESYLPALYEHGLMISRYSEDVLNEHGDVIHKQGEIYQVNDTEYFGKIMGCDSAEMYGGDKELTNSLNKNAMSPFDLLRMPVTAEIADLWNEYAIATKGKSCFRFARGFKPVIDEYFAQHPDRDPASASKPKESTVVSLKDFVYHLLYRNFKVEEVKRTLAGFVKVAGLNVSKLHDLLFEWLRKLFVDWGLPEPSEKDLFVGRKFVFARPPD